MLILSDFTEKSVVQGGVMKNQYSGSEFPKTGEAWTLFRINSGFGKKEGVVLCF